MIIPSLPPNVCGGVIGALVIHFKECSYRDVHARIQFWGENNFVELHPCGTDDEQGSVGDATGAAGSSTAEYQLVGSRFALHKYLSDASPLKVIFFRRARGNVPPSTVNDSGFELIGHASIQDLCFADLLHAGIERIDHSLRRRSQISRTGPNDIIGTALFQFSYKLVGQAAATSSYPQSLQRDLNVQRLTHTHMEMPLARQPGPSSTSHVQPYAHRPLQNHPSHMLIRPQQQLLLPSKNDGLAVSVNGDSIGAESGFGTSSTEEQQTLLEELLDLCADDMTMPTLDTANSVYDPTDMWISRIVAHASSPPAKEFPSLTSLGPNRSGALRKVGLVKIDFDELVLALRVVSKIKGTNDFSLQYRLPPNSGPADAAEEFVLRERFEARTKTPDTSGRMPHEHVSLMTTNHSKQMDVAFEEDNSVRQWLAGEMRFRIFCQASKQVNRPKLPRVAMLSSKRRGGKQGSAPAAERLCIAQASLKLRDIILSDALAMNATLDLLVVNGNTIKGLDEGAKIGSLSVKVALYPSNRKAQSNNDPDAEVPENTTENAAISFKGLQSPSPRSPHPISVFLSKFIKGDDANASTNVEHSRAFLPRGMQQKQSTDLPHTLRENEQSRCCDNSEKDGMKVSKSLKPVKDPPVWLDVRVHCISDLNVGVIDPCSLQLSMSCVDLISVGRKPHVQNIIGRKVNGSGLVSSSAVYSWQVAIKSECAGEKSSALTLQIGTSGDTDNTLIGLAEVPLLVHPPIGPQQKSCDWLPDISADGWFDLIDPRKSDSIVGRVKVTIASGMLRQIRSFSSVCNSVRIIQRWWKTSRTTADVRPERVAQETPLAVTSQCTAGKAQAPPNSYNDDVIETCHSTSPVRAVEEAKTNDLVSSPDSLFEEWSQQSMFIKRVKTPERQQSRDSIITDKPLLATVDCRKSSSSSGNDDDEVLTEVTGIPSNDIDASTATTKCSATACASRSDEWMRCNNLSESQTKADLGVLEDCEHFDVFVRLEKLCGLSATLSMWSRQQDNSCARTVLPASGVFVSYSIGQGSKSNETQHDMLCKLCSGNDVEHSRIVPVDAINADIELDLVSKLPVPNHETNTEIILSQMLEFKLWFVPVITKTIGTMLNCGNILAEEVLNGCTVIATARCPLYHLYTVKGCYGGRFPLEAGTSTHADKKEDGASGGFILATVSRTKDSESSSLGSPLISGDSSRVATSTLKPMNLEVSFSLGQESGNAKGVDPPEERKQPRKTSSSIKRKVEHCSMEGQREMKKCRPLINPETTVAAPPSPQAPKPHENDGVTNANNAVDESDTLCPSEGGFGEWDEDSSADDAVTYHSLNSVMESLGNIDSRLRHVNSFVTDHRREQGNACDSCATTPANDVKETGEGQRYETPVKRDMTLKSNCCAQKCTPAPMEPPDETSSRQQLEPPDDDTSNIRSGCAVNTCKKVERASSPIHRARECSDAATSPCGQSVVGNSAVVDEVVKGDDTAGTQENNEAVDQSENCLGDAQTQHLERHRANNIGQSRIQYASDYFTKSRLHLDGIPGKRISLLKSPYSHRLSRRTGRQVLSPVLKSSSPTAVRSSLLRGWASSSSQNGTFSPNAMEQTRPMPRADSEIKTSATDEKERLERIFQSKQASTTRNG